MYNNLCVPSHGSETLHGIISYFRFIVHAQHHGGDLLVLFFVDTVRRMQLLAVFRDYEH